MRQKQSKDLAGRTFGYWKVKDECITTASGRKWKCRCQCGKEKLVYESNLLSGRSRSCGCYSAEAARARIKDLAGQKFGRLTVIERTLNGQSGRVCWRCQCECGTECVVAGHELTAGKTKSCGCLKKESSNMIDLKKRKFGKLTVQYATEKRSYKGSVIWHCKCKCGNELDVAADDLLYGGYVSCGCKREEWQRQIHKTLHRVESTCVEFLEKRNHRQDNKSGYQGVHKISNNKYRSTIGFNGQRYHLGYYNTFEEAVEVRKEAEEILHKGFVKIYYEWKEHADRDPLWAQKNPIRVDVSVNHDTKKIEITREFGSLITHKKEARDETVMADISDNDYNRCFAPDGMR